MNKTTPEQAPLDSYAAQAAQQTKPNYARGLAVALLIVAFGVVTSFARYEKKQADFWKAEALAQSARTYQAPHQATATRYPVTVIGEDGSQTPLAAKALHIDMGGERLLEVDLTEHKNGYLQMWSPARRDDPYFNRLAFHPSCSNAFYLELVRVQLKGASDGENDFVVKTAP